MTKSIRNCGFGHIYWRNPSWKTSFFVQRFIVKFVGDIWGAQVGSQISGKPIVMKDLKVFLKDIRKHSPRVFRRSHPQRCSTKKNFLRNFAKFTGKHLCQSLFWKETAALLKKRLWHRCFPVIFANILRALFLTKHLRQLVLYLCETPISL